ncbi:MAG: flagellar basal body P-ring protein FlgI [Proteobacteria bacterium]|uniref:Flagellar P-ring protein n=1 Tax=Candidatus Avisuccinivibrio stercorigallinarum TaxID=2840704 RepID=A0A9D9DAI5_9GAMM|nr:flagellar basal body P-ring protein FlgI [Candidatus Avisuccinivibrio stercorigallinarum]
MHKLAKFLLTAAALLCFGLTQVQAVRLKDLASVEGVRANQLIGYGLVVGLAGTGEKNSDFSEQSFRSMLNNFGIKIDENTNLKIKDVAPVVVHAELPPFAKPGQTIDVTVSAIGEATSLRGGSLLQTVLRGIDGNVYAIAQGSLVVGGLGVEGADGSRVTVNTPTAGRIANGAIVERSVPSNFSSSDSIVFNLNRADFTSAKNVAESINEIFGRGTAQAVDAVSIRVGAPRDPSRRVEFLSVLENLDIQEGDGKAKIVVNSRTGTIVIGSMVRLKPVAVTHGGLTVTVTEDPQVSQPNSFSMGQTAIVPNSNIQVNEKQGKMFKFDTGTTLDDLVRAVNEVGLAPGDLMSVLEALDQAGAIEGELVVI